MRKMWIALALAASVVGSGAQAAERSSRYSESEAIGYALSGSEVKGVSFETLSFAATASAKGGAEIDTARGYGAARYVVTATVDGKPFTISLHYNDHIGRPGQEMLGSVMIGTRVFEGRFTFAEGKSCASSRCPASLRVRVDPGSSLLSEPPFPLGANELIILLPAN